MLCQEATQAEPFQPLSDMQLRELKAEDDKAEAELQQLRDRLGASKATLAEVQGQLRRHGVATPHGRSAEEEEAREALLVRRLQGGKETRLPVLCGSWLAAT